jgi:hypothetical protein
VAEQWKPTKTTDIQPGDRIRTADGAEMTATRVEHNFFGRADMIAFIEDTPQRWFKRPMPIDADVEVLAAD